MNGLTNPEGTPISDLSTPKGIPVAELSQVRDLDIQGMIMVKTDAEGESKLYTIIKGTWDLVWEMSDDPLLFENFSAGLVTVLSYTKTEDGVTQVLNEAWAVGGMQSPQGIDLGFVQTILSEDKTRENCPWDFPY